MARLELEIVLSTLFARVPNPRVAVPVDHLPYKHDSTLYGLHELPVTWLVDRADPHSGHNSATARREYLRGGLGQVLPPHPAADSPPDRARGLGWATPPAGARRGITHERALRAPGHIGPDIAVGAVAVAPCQEPGMSRHRLLTEIAQQHPRMVAHSLIACTNARPYITPW
jgi:hypothetical protein